MQLKKQFIPHLEKIYPTNSRKTSTFALVKQTLSQRCLELNIIVNIKTIKNYGLYFQSNKIG